MPSAQGPAAQGPAAFARNLLEHLTQEIGALERMLQGLDDQLSALQRQDRERLEATTLAISDEVNALSRHQQARERQMRLLSRILKLETETTSLEDLAHALAHQPDGRPVSEALLEERSRVRALAQTTQQRCEELEFALQYAVKLGRELLQAVQNLDVPPPTRVYTALGRSSETSPNRSFLNKVG